MREVRSGRDSADDDEAGASGIEDRLGQAFIYHDMHRHLETTLLTKSLAHCFKGGQQYAFLANHSLYSKQRAKNRN